MLTTSHFNKSAFLSEFLKQRTETAAWGFIIESAVTIGVPADVKYKISGQYEPLVDDQ